MKTSNFVSLIRAITGRDFYISTQSEDILPECTYSIRRKLPVTEMEVGFEFKTPKNEERLLKSFITTFCNKYREPDPDCYDGSYPGSKSWADKTERDREHCYLNHASYMYSKEQLLEIIRTNVDRTDFTDALCKYGFYPTNYGIGIYVVFVGAREMEAIEKMAQFLKGENIKFTNEFSDARWVFRFKLNVDKLFHTAFLNKFIQFTNL